MTRVHEAVRVGPHKEGTFGQRDQGARTEEGHVGVQQEGSLSKPRREATGGAKPADTFIWDFQPPKPKK